MVGASASDSGQLCDQPSPPTTSTSDDFCVFPTPMRAACAQVWLVPTSTHALRPRERAVAARWVSTRHRRPRAAAAKSRFLRFCRVCQTPCSPCAYRIARSRRSAVGALHHLDQAQAAYRAAARHGRQFSAVAKLRYSAYGCVLPKIDHYIFKSKEKCSTNGFPEPHSPTL